MLRRQTLPAWLTADLGFCEFECFSPSSPKSHAAETSVSYSRLRNLPEHQGFVPSLLTTTILPGWKGRVAFQKREDWRWDEDLKEKYFIPSFTADATPLSDQSTSSFVA